MNHQQQRDQASRQRKRQENALRPAEVQPIEKAHLHYEERVPGRLRLADSDVVMPDGVRKIHIVEGQKLAGGEWQARGRNQ